MLLTIIYFFPCIVALMWSVTYAFKVKTQRQSLMMWIRIVGVIYYAAYALYTLPETDYDSMVRIETISVPFSLALMAMEVMFLYMHFNPSCRLQPVHLFGLLPALVVGTVVNLLYYILGFEQTAHLIEILDQNGGVRPAEYDNVLWHLYGFFDQHIINILAAIYFLSILTLCILTLRRGGNKLGDTLRFFFKHNTSTPSRVISVLYILTVFTLIPMVGLGRTFMIDHQMLTVLNSLILAITMHLISHVEFFCNGNETVTLYKLSHIEAMKASATIEQLQPTAEADTMTEAKVVEKKLSKKDKMTEKVIDLLERQEVFRQDDLSMQTLSEMSGIGRTTLSQIISEHYEEPFRNVVNKMRIEAVKKYIIENPAATQELIAQECGFKDASSLNHKFKEIEGDTPLVWLANMQDSNNK